VASLSQGRTAAAQCGLFTHKSVPVIFEPPCIYSGYAICERLVKIFDSVEAAFSIVSQLETTSTLVFQKWIEFSKLRTVQKI